MADTTLSPGTELKNGGYRIERLIGQGGFGAVYLAHDLVMDAPCAIKESQDISTAVRRQFDAEARILANLSHPNLPRVTDNFIEPSGRQYLVMEYVEGQDLSELVEQAGPLPQDQVLAWIDQVLDAVSYLHTYHPRPLIHRDIKPANIRLLPDGHTVKLVDFGIAKVGGSADRTQGAARGVTPGFSPPEQYSGEGTDRYSDVYALGATLYVLLTQDVPPDAVQLAIGQATLRPPRALNAGIRPQVEQVILTAMQATPARRYPSACEMRQALQGQPAPSAACTCPYCGATVRATSRFCLSCGKPLGQAQPFLFPQSGYQAQDLEGLVLGCDSYWQEAATLYQQGAIDAWLARLGGVGPQLAARGQALRAQYAHPWAALEAFLELAAPARSLPLLAVHPTGLDLGQVDAGTQRTLALSLSNHGRGYLYGEVSSQAGWVRVQPARFGCLAGATQQIQVVVDTAQLAGTEQGTAYSGQIAVRSSRGSQALSVLLRVVARPQARLSPNPLALGTVEWGSRPQKQIVVSNAGGGALHGQVVAGAPWLAVDPSGQPFRLGTGQSASIGVRVETDSFPQRGQYSGQIVLQSNDRGTHAADVTLEVDLPCLLDPARPDLRVADVAGWIELCDRDWEWGVSTLGTGSVEAFLRFVGADAALIRAASAARRAPDPNAGLEIVLREAGAAPARRFSANYQQVLRELGYGLFARQRDRAPTVTLAIQNTSRRGYLYGYIEPLVPWLEVLQPRFGCLPGESAQVLLVDNGQPRKQKGLSPGVDLFEIVTE